MDRVKPSVVVLVIFGVLFGLWSGFTLFMDVQAQIPRRPQIAFTSERDGNYEIYVMDADGSNQINLTNYPADDGSPSWSP